MEFNIGQIFEGSYPPEVADWCNARNDCFIADIDPIDGVRRFQIAKVPEPTDEDVAEQIRAERDGKIAATDYLMMPDYPLPEEDRATVVAYRQALRDIPTQDGFPREVVWPEAPAVFKRTQG